MASVSFITSQRGGRILLFEQYLYRISRKTKNKTHWRCATSNKCRSNVVLENDVFYKSSGFHTHEPKTEKVRRMLFSNRLKERCKSEVNVAVPTIYREELAKAADRLESTSIFPSFNAKNKSMYRARAEGRRTCQSTTEEFPKIDQEKKADNKRANSPTNEGSVREQIQEKNEEPSSHQIKISEVVGQVSQIEMPSASQTEMPSKTNSESDSPAFRETIKIEVDADLPYFSEETADPLRCLQALIPDISYLEREPTANTQRLESECDNAVARSSDIAKFSNIADSNQRVPPILSNRFQSPEDSNQSVPPIISNRFQSLEDPTMYCSTILNPTHETDPVSITHPYHGDSTLSLGYSKSKNSDLSSVERENLPEQSTMSSSSANEFSSAESVRRKDKFDVYGEYFAEELRSIDPKSCAFIQKVVGDLLFEAKVGRLLTTNEKTNLDFKRNFIMGQMVFNRTNL